MEKDEANIPKSPKYMEQHFGTEWRIDKHVPVTLIIAFMAQTIVLVYFGTTWKTEIDSRVNYLERAGIHAEQVDVANTLRDRRVDVLETKLDNFLNSLRRIEDGIATLNKGKVAQ